MPIKPELRYFYPIDWPQISHWVRFVRAKGRCQVCGRPHGGILTLSSAAALQKIAAAGAPFASRGDDSGTHKAEQKLWQTAGVDTKAPSGT